VSLTFRLVVGEEHDEVMYAPGGIVDRWVRGVASEMYFWMEREVPVNKRSNKSGSEPPVGTLRALIFSDVDRIGPHEMTIQAGSRAHYTRYVVEGTSTIYAKSNRSAGGQFMSLGDDGEGGGMYLPANPGYGRARWRQRVRGQSANNFIGRAYDQTARVHPALKGVSME
jgi:hypothetical protein